MYYRGITVKTQSDRLVALNVRVPRALKVLIREYVALHAHKDMSEFVRDAVRRRLEEMGFNPQEAQKLRENCQ
jgi:Arc/MetJ-type ribon-helix-helix transcriptional regulator